MSGVQPEIWMKRQDVTQAQAVLERCSQFSIDTYEENDIGRP